MVKESCSDSCVGTRYRCIEAEGCSNYPLTSFSSCTYGSLECDDGCGNIKYKCDSVCPSSISTLDTLNMVLSGECSNRDTQTSYNITKSISGTFDYCLSDCDYSFTLNLGGNTLSGDLDFRYMDGGVTLSLVLLQEKLRGQFLVL